MPNGGMSHDEISCYSRRDGNRRADHICGCSHPRERDHHTERRQNLSHLGQLQIRRRRRIRQRRQMPYSRVHRNHQRRRQRHLRHRHLLKKRQNESDMHRQRRRHGALIRRRHVQNHTQISQLSYWCQRIIRSDHRRSHRSRTLLSHVPGHRPHNQRGRADGQSMRHIQSSNPVTGSQLQTHHDIQIRESLKNRDVQRRLLSRVQPENNHLIT